MVTKWEYKVEPYEPTEKAGYDPGELTKALNKLGEQGWELASLIRDESGDTEHDVWYTFTLFLKRPL